MTKTLTLRIDNRTYKTFVNRAKSQNRTVANFIENAVKEHILEQDFIDDFEMSGILSDRSLMRRLKRGSKEVKTRKGKLIG
jgi:predicted DNA-binding protein